MKNACFAILFVCIVLMPQRAIFSADVDCWECSIKRNRIQHFFPTGEARIDGYQVAHASWQDYIDVNKWIFVREYLLELEKEFDITLDLGHWGLDPFDTYIQERAQKEGSAILIAPLIRDFLSQRCILPGKECQSQYAHTTDAMPSIFFFPKDKAQWDGYTVDMYAWGVLSELQKHMFVTEYVQELEKKYGTQIEITPWHYLIAIDGVSKSSHNEWVTEFFESILKKEGKLKPDKK
ncbi:hypothetical protein ACFL38_04600 [Candidatus Omnitrophota bacterium]